jgi:hypothetical protein
MAVLPAIFNNDPAIVEESVERLTFNRQRYSYFADGFAT